MFVLGGGGEGVTRLEFVGGGARVGTASLVVGGATCIGGVVFRAAPTRIYNSNQTEEISDVYLIPVLKCMQGTFLGKETCPHFRGVTSRKYIH